MNILNTELDCKNLFTKRELQNKIKELGKQITKDYKGKSLVVFGLADGGLMFAMDLIREIKLPLQYNTIVVKSYGNNYQSNGKPNIYYFPFLDLDLTNKDVLIIDDIKDSGNTLQFIKDYILNKFNNVNSIEYCVLVKNINNNNDDINCKYYAFENNGQWLIGYGLDDKQLYRNLNKIVYKNI